MFGSISSPWWDDRPVAIVAGGKSLAGFDFKKLEGASHVLAVKGSIFDLPFAEVGFGIDVPRFKEWREKLQHVPFPVYWAIPDHKFNECGGVVKNVTYLKRLEGEGVSTNPSAVYSGGTSGFGALQFALLKRAKQIFLFGYDYNHEDFTKPQHPRTGRYRPENFRHNDQHYGTVREQNARNWRMWASYYNHFLPFQHRNGVEIVNVNPSSAIQTFSKVSLEDAVRALHRV